MICKVCGNKSSLLFNTKVLHKYDVDYFKCTNCQFIQTENTHWLSESYSNAITNLDIGLVYRNILFSKIVNNIIFWFFNKKGKFVDYGGGYGMFVRIMRDMGFDFYRQDKYCDNLFAVHFDVEDVAFQKYEMLTAFEVFEHLEDPIGELEKMMQYSDNILFSTELQPNDISTPEDWRYFIPTTGQHIALHSHKSLNILASKYGFNYYNRKSMHLFTRKKLNHLIFKILSIGEFASFFNLIFKRNSLLMSDYEKIKKINYENSI